MSKAEYLFKIIALLVLFSGVSLLFPVRGRAHCDTLDGPVVAAAKLALEKGAVTPVLKWVRQADENEIREAFDKTLAVRTKGPEARELADMYFFETLVRVHRAGEGAPFTGLKPAGTEMDQAVSEADKALETGSPDKLEKMLTTVVAGGIHERFARAVQTKKHAEESVEAGREFVDAYVTFVHYVEHLHQEATGAGASHGDAQGAGTGEHSIH